METCAADYCYDVPLAQLRTLQFAVGKPKGYPLACPIKHNPANKSQAEF